MSDLVRLGDHVDLLTGFPFKSAGYVETPDSVRLLRGDNIAQGRCRWDGAKRWPLSEVSKYGQYELCPGDVVLAMDRPWIEAGLKYAQLRDEDVPCLLVQRVARLRARDSLDQRFLGYLIGSPRFTEYVLAVQTGTAVPHISGQQICDFQFVLPALRDQRAIASVLGALDDKIAVNERIAATTRDLAVALFKQAVGTEDVEEPEVGALAELVTRGVTPKYTEDESELIVLNQRCIREGRVSLAPARRTLATKVPAGKRLRANDVLVNSTGVGTLGRVARWPGGQEATVDSHVTIVRFDSTKVDVLCAWFAMLAAQPVIERLGEGSTGQTELSRNKLASLSLRVPSREAQASIARQLGELELCGEAALAESQMLAALRDTLLPGLISGAIRVRDAEKIVEDVT